MLRTGRKCARSWRHDGNRGASNAGSGTIPMPTSRIWSTGASSYLCQPRKKTPELTLDRVVRLLWSAIGVPQLSIEAAIELVDYHINRNRIARNSHMKSWMLKNGDRIAKFVPL